MRPEKRETRTTEETIPAPPYLSANDSSLPDRMRVLVVDDNPINRKLLKLLLEAEGHSVVEADNGVAALQGLEQSQIDAVISDILMPEMDGYRLCYEIRKSPKFSHLPFIVYTASYTSPSDEKLALQFGVDKFIRKPASSNDIINSLYDLFATASKREQKDVEKPAEAEVMREYSQVLVRKLEETIVELSEANKSLAERTALAEFVATVSTALSEANGLQGMLQRCSDAMVKHLEAALARIWTFNEKENILELQASSGIYTHIDGGHSRVPVGQFKIGLIASERAPHLTNSVIGDARVHDQEWARREGMVAFAGYPMMIGDQLVGVMAAFARKPLSQNTLDVMGTVARNIAVGVQRQLAEGELRRSEERFRELAENVNEIFFVAGAEGKPVHYVSPAYEQITGLKCEALYRNPGAWLEIIHPDDRSRVEQSMRDHADNLDEKYRILRPDGSERWLHSRSFPVKDGDGDVRRVVGVTADVTERERAEAKVIQNLNRIRARHEIDLAITSTLDLPTVLKVLLEKIENLFPYPTVTTVRLLNRTTGDLEVLACHNVDMEDWKSSFIGERSGRAYKVLDSKVPLLVRNVLAHLDTVNPTLFQKYGLVSYIGLPLIAKDQALGVLNFYTKQDHEFSPEEIKFLMMLASQAAIAIHNARLYEETERRRREAEELARVARSLTETLDISVVGERIVTSVRELFSVHGAVLRLCQTDGSLRRLASSGEVFSQSSVGDTVPSGVGLTRQAISEGRPVWSRDILNEPAIVLTEEMRDYQIRSGNRSMIAVPLRAHEKLIGALTLSDRTGRNYADSEVALVQTFADQAALALENARLYEETGRAKKTLETTNRYLERSMKQLGGFYTALTPITTAASTQAMMGGIIDRLIEATGADAALIRVWDSNADRYPIISQRNFPQEYLNAVASAPSGGAVDWVIRHGEPVIAPDIALEPRLRGKKQIQLGLRSCAMLPLKVHGEVRGVMHIASRKLGYFDEEQKDHLTAIVRQMSIALENRELFDDLRSSRDELERTNVALKESNKMLSALHEVAAAASQSLELDRVLQAAIERITDIFGFHATQIHIYNEQTDELLRRAAFEKDSDRFASAGSFKKGHGIVGTVAESGKALIFEDVETDPGYRQLSQSKVSRRFGYHFFAVFPIKSKLKILGTLAFTNAAPRKLSPGEVQLLEALADQIAVAVENSDLYEKVRQKVQELEQKTGELERAYKVKDEFLSVMSHELRTPLSVVTGYSAMLRQEQLGPLTGEQEHALNVIQRNSQELYAMIDSIMDATKIEAGSMVAEMDTVSPPQLLAELKLSYEFPNRKNIRFEWNFSAALPPLWTDARKLRQILTNLINNAIKFTDEGSIVISAEERIEAEAGGHRRWIEFRVADSGIGIPPEDIEKIFERFHQVDSSETRSFEGVGLGLYIVKSFTEMLGGQVSVESVVGKGSTFTVSFPLEIAPQGGSARPSPPSD